MPTFEKLGVFLEQKAEWNGEKYSDNLRNKYSSRTSTYWPGGYGYMFVAFCEQLHTFFKVGFHFLKLRLFGGDLTLSMVLPNLRLNLNWSSFAFLLELVELVEFELINLLHLQFRGIFVSALYLADGFFEEIFEGIH
ncbi:hypothetical protein OS493_028378 [Desmophyllum pertusum]|uniref:Uncharacterized protein n=1 Tax=Desmophyllum pertusum TaxID=174260 RepID=A0A9W9ZYP4_9CNID|nr:hypothetical protein OS493_028378 [Desmophyllum pertusum]